MLHAELLVNYGWLRVTSRAPHGCLVHVSFACERLRNCNRAPTPNRPIPVRGGDHYMILLVRKARMHGMRRHYLQRHSWVV